LPGYRWLSANGGTENAIVPSRLNSSLKDVGYALSPKHIRPDIDDRSQNEIHQAALLTIPDVPVLFLVVPHHGCSRVLLYRPFWR
jgi:cytochrome d ubiquinol oxidase subunit I